MPQFRGKARKAIAPVVLLLTEIGERHGMDAGQVALRWLVEKDVLPIPGAKNAAQAATNAGALTFALSPEEFQALDSATRRWRA
jgi:aryl-alcohol dehydrogenase-like predicted oxidoreductase